MHVKPRTGSEQQSGATDAVLFVECSSVQRVETPNLKGQNTMGSPGEAPRVGNGNGRL